MKLFGIIIGLALMTGAGAQSSTGAFLVQMTAGLVIFALALRKPRW